MRDTVNMLFIVAQTINGRFQLAEKNIFGVFAFNVGFK